MKHLHRDMLAKHTIMQAQNMANIGTPMPKGFLQEIAVIQDSCVWRRCSRGKEDQDTKKPVLMIITVRPTFHQSDREDFEYIEALVCYPIVTYA
eukprot:gene933-4187_t